MQLLLNVLLARVLLVPAAAAAAGEAAPPVPPVPPPTPPKPDERAKQIAQLEKQKSELFQQLNAAIDDSVRSLRANNDSEAAVGISYIEDLREKMKALNASPAQVTSERVQTQGAEIVDPEEDFRRKSRGAGKSRSPSKAGALRQIKVLQMKQSDTKLFQVKNVFGDKARHPKRWQERYENRVLMQQKLEQWLAQREKERQDIKKVMKAARDKEEKCPRFGSVKTKKKKKKGSRRAGEGGEGGKGGLDKMDEKGVPGGAGNKYPCCRKCCKKSYLGCL